MKPFRFLCLVLIINSSLHAANWPQFRGPFFNGSTDEKNLPDTWSENENIAWTAALPGPSAATPVVWNDRIFISCADPDADMLKALCLERSTGKILWRHNVSKGITRTYRSNFASPTPATDGTLVDVIEDVIEMGVDVLNPVQTSAMGMDTYVLKEKYGDRLSFHGAIDVQQVLPSSTPEEVKYDVAKRIYDLGRGGGYILSPCHNIGADVPPENIVAMFEAAQIYGRYPLQLDTVLEAEDLNPTKDRADNGQSKKTVTRRRRRPRKCL